MGLKMKTNTLQYKTLNLDISKRNNSVKLARLRTSYQLYILEVLKVLRVLKSCILSTPLIHIKCSFTQNLWIVFYGVRSLLLVCLSLKVSYLRVWAFESLDCVLDMSTVGIFTYSLTLQVALIRDIFTKALDNAHIKNIRGVIGILMSEIL